MRNLSKVIVALALLGIGGCSKMAIQEGGPGQSELGDKSISGWFAKTEYNGRSLKLTHFWFKPDGRVFLGRPPGGFSDADFKALEQSDPTECGTYVIKGKRLTIQRKGAPPETHFYTTEVHGMMDNSPLIPAWVFPNGAMIEGQWSAVGGSNLDGVRANAPKVWRFRRDGTVETSGHAGLDVKTTTGRTSDTKTGRYQFQNGKLNVKYADGSTVSHDAYGTSKFESPYVLGIDGVDYHPNF